MPTTRKVGAFIRRLWWSFVQQRLIFIICILTAILLPLSFVIINAVLVKMKYNMGLIVSHEEITINKWDRKHFMDGADKFVEIVATPNTSDVRRVMDSAVKLLVNGYEKLEYMDNEEEATKHLLKNFSSLSYGVYFHELSPNRLDYTLRHGVDPKTTVSTSKKYPGAEDAIANERTDYHCNFLPMQIAIDESYVTTFLRGNNSDREKPKPDVKDWLLTIAPFPTHQVITKGYIRVVIMVIIIWQSLLPFMARVGALTTLDKTSGINELFHLNGVPKWMYNLGWLVFLSIIMFFVAIINTVILKIPIGDMAAVLHHADAAYLLLILTVYYSASVFAVGHLAAIIASPALFLPLLYAYWTLTMIIPGAYLYMVVNSRSKVLLVLMALLPNGALPQIFEVYHMYVTVDEELGYSNAFHKPFGDQIPVGWTLTLMALSILLYGVLVLYNNAVRPGPYGRAVPWYLYEKPQKTEQQEQGEQTTPTKGQNSSPPKGQKLSTTKGHHSSLPTGGKEHANIPPSPFIEDLNKDVPIGLKVTKLVKKYGHFTAVNNLSLNFVKNQITALLGHNGAGKTTFFNIISGMFSPTSGSVTTAEYDIFHGGNIERFRKEMGYCPQHNFLLNELTVEQHLILFGILKGMSSKTAKESSDKWCGTFHIDDISKRRSVSKLSGGTKRKVCLAIAMLGEPKYLLLDEPTAALDPESRREIWNVLLNIRGSCTIIVTTHFMEEAEVLGDKIAIMAHGQLKCFGSSMFLKRKYGFGYKLRATKEKSEGERLIARVQRHIAGAEITNETDRTVEIKLPATEVNNFPGLLHELESDKRLEYTLAYSTVDDIFIKVQEEEGEQIGVTDMPNTDTDTAEPVRTLGEEIVSLMILKVKWTIANWRYALVLVVIWPLFCFFLTAIASPLAETQHYSESFPKITLTLDYYKGFTALLAPAVGSDPIFQGLLVAINQADSNYEILERSESLDVLLDKYAKSGQRLNYVSNTIFSFATANRPIVYFSPVPNHAMPIAYGALINAMINTEGTITTSNYPYRSKGDQCKEYNVFVLALIWVIFACTGLMYVCAYFIMFPHADRMTIFRHLQLITGIFPTVYWLSILVVDFIIYLIVVAISIMVFFTVDNTELFSSGVVLGALTLVFFLHGIGGILSAYFCSYFFKKPNYTIEFYTDVLLVGSLLAVLLKSMSWGRVEYLYFMPSVIMCMAVEKIIQWSSDSHTCQYCEDVGESCKAIEGQSLIGLLLSEIIWFFISSLLYLVILTCVDLGAWGAISARITKLIYGGIKEENHTPNTDVEAEKQRIKEILGRDVAGEGDEERPIFISDGIGKKYKKRTVVYDVSFGMNKGECFGLLGANGAGKSTTFGMLAGNVKPTKGDAMVGEHKLSRWSHRYLKRVGYCPQFEGLLSDLSANTLISHFMRLRGFKWSKIKPLTQKWVEAMGMTEICHRPSRTYSGGNKKKLSLVLSLIGNPAVVFLDEPSTGVDVVIMRRIWEVLKYCLDINKQTIVVTSHSMSECEAVCGRLTVLMEGVMQCIGAVPKLKQIFGTSRIIQVKMTHSSTEQDQNEIQAQIQSKLAPHVNIEDRQRGFLSFTVHARGPKLSDLFTFMIKMKNNNQNIEDFNVSDAAFEQVFLSYTKEQRKEKENNIPEGSDQSQSKNVKSKPSETLRDIDPSDKSKQDSKRSTHVGIPKI